MDAKTKLALMREMAAAKARVAGVAPEFLRQLEANLEVIALAKLTLPSPMTENLLGIAYTLLFCAKGAR